MTNQFGPTGILQRLNVHKCFSTTASLDIDALCLTYMLYDVVGWDQTVHPGRFMPNNFRVCIIVTLVIRGGSSGSVTSSSHETFQYVLDTRQGAPALDQRALSPYLRFPPKRHDVIQLVLRKSRTRPTGRTVWNGR